MLKGKLTTIRTVDERGPEALYRLSMGYSNAGEFMPVELVSETSFKIEFRQTGFWQDTAGKPVIENRDGNLVGEIGYFEVAHYLDDREVYCRIFDGHRQKGHAGDALRRFVDFFFESNGFHRLQALTVDGNEASAGMLQKPGFEYEGQLREARWFTGKLVELDAYPYLRSDWKN